MEEQKKLLIMLPNIDFAGAELLACYQARNLSAKYRVTILVLGRVVNQEVLGDKVESGKLNIIELNTGIEVLDKNSLQSLFFNINKIKKAIRNISPDLIIAHLPISHLVSKLINLLSKDKFKIVCYHHGMLVDGSNQSYFAKFKNSLLLHLNTILIGSSQIQHIFISLAVKDDVVRYEKLARENGVIVYNTIPFSDLGDQQVGTNSDIEKASIKIVIPGRLQWEKGTLFFLDVLKAFKDNPLYGQCYFKFCGGGPLHNQAMDLICANGLSENVSITGALGHVDILNEINNADIVVIPSLVEGLSIVALESLYLSKVVLSSDAGGLPEVIQDKINGYLFAHGDIPSCVEALIAVLTLYRENNTISGSAIKDSYERKFSGTNHLAKLELVIDSMLC